MITTKNDLVKLRGELTSMILSLCNSTIEICDETSRIKKIVDDLEQKNQEESPEFNVEEGPSPLVVKNEFASIATNKPSTDLCPIVLCNTISKMHERNAYVVWLMMFNRCKLEDVISLQKKDLFREGIPKHILSVIDMMSMDSVKYLFETRNHTAISHGHVSSQITLAGARMNITGNLTSRTFYYGFIRSKEWCERTRPDLLRCFL